MKICHMTSVHSPFDIRIFIKECTSLAQTGFEVHYIVPGIEDTKVKDVFIHGISKGSGNRIHRMTTTVNSVYMKALDINADVYHFHDSELIPIGLKLKRKGKTIIYDIHEDLPRALLSKKWITPLIRKPLANLLEIYENNSAKKFDYLITATPFITERFIRINSNTTNINNYPLLKELQSTSDKEQRFKRKQVCYVGGLGSIRGSNQLLEAANFINGTIQVAGPLSPKELEDKLNVHGSFNYLGNISREEVKELLSASMAGIVTFLPEPNHINAQPNKMFEYMSAGIPVICSNFPLWRSIIERHNCGICVDPESPKDISSAINYLFENPEIAKKMGENGRRAVEGEYNWERESQKLISIYQKINK
ncbi:glycosyltransferase family 4 protein [Planococcus citreus]|uniref:Glycosyltransferase involved in cell wall biosynthesis n=1 Tax=Planococcus citreus TaxID=1373 RepID=A0A497YKE0_9BACL|nr:glycosyltransferase family 4 protein [Planococcus citreus]RLJ90665.1 glycosyltransferase involved in cell wall biosynthesis [Planococcus citreus]